jgi:hypothetical protein
VENARKNHDAQTGIPKKRRVRRLPANVEMHPPAMEPTAAPNRNRVAGKK